MELSDLCFVFHQNQLLVNSDNPVNPIPAFQDVDPFHFKITSQHLIGYWNNKTCFGLDIEQAELLPPKFHFQPLRQAALHLLSPDIFYLAGRASQILEWDKTHQFCSRCGSVVKASETERVKICPNCKLLFYPRISPSMIVAVTKEDKILLARSPHFTEKVYSILAGFVEPGESAEETVHREVQEEVGIKIKNLKYHHSQPWPFSNSLMLGYTAEYDSGEIVIDGVEIEDAGWFSRDNLPPLPTPISISRKLIDMFINKQL